MIDSRETDNIFHFIKPYLCSFMYPDLIRFQVF